MKKNPRAHKPSTGRVLRLRRIVRDVNASMVDAFLDRLDDSACRKHVPLLPYESPRAARKRIGVVRPFVTLSKRKPPLSVRTWDAIDLERLLDLRKQRLAAKVARANAHKPHPAVIAILSPFDHAAIRRSRSHGCVPPTPMNPRVSLALAFKGSMTKGGVRIR